MTLLAVTIAADRAVISQDNFVVEPTAAQLKRAERLTGYAQTVEELAASMYPGGGGPETVHLVGRACKIFAAPELSMAMAGTGSFGFITDWWLTIASTWATDLADLNRQTPALLRELHRQRGGHDAGIIVHAGPGSGTLFAHGQDFEPIDIPIGSTMSPVPEEDDPAYPGIYDLWTEANQGRSIEHLHHAVYEHMCQAYMTGRLTPGGAVGGGLTHVVVTADSITIKAAPERRDVSIAA